MTTKTNAANAMGATNMANVTRMENATSAMKETSVANATSSPRATNVSTMTRRTFLGASAIGALSLMAGCSTQAQDASADGDESATLPSGTLALDSAAWNYDSDNDVYWQVGAVYCEQPVTTEYQSLGIYVPGAYFSAEDNGDGTYTCSIDSSGEVAGLTAATAPVVIPINSAGYSAQSAPTSYSYDTVSDYLEAGFVYVYAGFRGRSNGYDDDGNLTFCGGAPWSITDLKAAVRFIRYNKALLPGDVDSVFTFGHSGGGAQSALMGATGDSPLFTPYLESIGAAMSDPDGAELSDAVAGSMCWCPITCLDQADAAYEWMMGQYVSSSTRAEGVWTAEFSLDLAKRYAEYINAAGFVDADGTVLSLEESDDGVFASGTYYDAVLAAIEESLNNFLSDTEFPYTPSGTTMADGGFGGGLEGSGTDAGAPERTGDLPDADSESGTPSGELPDGELPDADSESGPPSGGLSDGDLPDDLEGSAGPSGDAGGDSQEESSVTYDTVQDYIATLNEDEQWVVYDEASNTATVTSVDALVRHCKSPSKDVGAFDALDRSAAENLVFGNAEADALHFDGTMADLLAANQDSYAQLEGWDESYVQDYADDRTKLDDLGATMDERIAMYNPLYFISDAYEGAGTSVVAPCWRIRTGIEQGDTSLTTELNLALALASNADVEDVDFATVWGQGHTTAERTGSSTDNFIEWVKEHLVL